MPDTLLKYLEDYLHNPQILSLPEFNQMDIPIPDLWGAILQERGRRRKEMLLEAWSYYQKELPGVYELLEERLERVELLHHRGGVSLLYILLSNGKTYCYEGRNPCQTSMRPEIKRVWRSLPKKLKSFYDELHNGWFYLPSESLGPAPVESFFFLSEDEWGILDEIGKDLRFNMETMLAVFTNGAGGYLCIDTASEPIDTDSPKSIIWWHDGPPDLEIDFWGVMDAWTEIGLTT
jgi:hypothetical protein